MTQAYEDQLATYLGRQRWFAGKDRAFTISDVVRLPEISSEPALRIELVTVRYDNGQQETYQIPTAYVAEPDGTYDHALIGAREEDGRLSYGYDAVHVKSASHVLLEAFRDGYRDEHLAFVTVEGAELPGPDAHGVMMTAEQSNTSIAYDSSALLKVFRRVADGRNPDIEIHHSLTVAGSSHVAPLLGWYEGHWADDSGDRHEAHLGMLQAFLRTASDGWELARASVRDLFVEENSPPSEVGGDFAGEAERLGEATAEIHVELADAFGVTEWDPAALDRELDAILARMEQTIGDVSVLGPYRAGLTGLIEQARSVPTPIPAQRIHGDLHLGQTLRTVKGWKFIDFEGEPNRPLAERSAPDSPLRDIAGMLRSFAYAAGSGATQFGVDQEYVELADAWSKRNRRAFLRGYGLASDLDFKAYQPLLRAYEAEKVVYEVGYEAGNRPAWLPIPMHAIEQIATEVA